MSTYSITVESTDYTITRVVINGQMFVPAVQRDREVDEAFKRGLDQGTPRRGSHVQIRDEEVVELPPRLFSTNLPSHVTPGEE